MAILRPRADQQQVSSGVPAAITTPLIVVSAIFPVLSAISIGLKHFAQRKGSSRWFVEDGWLWFSWISALALSIDVWIFARSGINYYTVPVLDGTQDSLRMIWLGSILVQLPLTTVKIAILLFYKRIFSIKTRLFAICIWIAITIVSIWGVLFFLLCLVQINPISVDGILNVKLRFDSTSMGLAQVGTSIVLDLLVLCLPLPIILSLHMPRNRKVAISLIFWLGAFCVVAAIVRLILLEKSLAQIDADYSLVYLQDKIFIFKVIEPNTSIIAACLPLYGPLIKTWRLPESIIRSVRSIISLASLDRRNSGSGSGRPQQNLENAPESQTELGAYARLSEQQKIDNMRAISETSIPPTKDQTTSTPDHRTSTV